MHQISPLNHSQTRQQSPYVTTVKWRNICDSSVGIATGAGGSLSSPGKGKIFFSSLKRSDRFWDPPTQPPMQEAPGASFSTCHAVGRPADHSAKNTPSYTCFTHTFARHQLYLSPTIGLSVHLRHNQTAVKCVCVSSQHNCTFIHRIRDQPICSTSSYYTGQ